MQCIIVICVLPSLCLHFSVVQRSSMGDPSFIHSSSSFQLQILNKKQVDSNTSAAWLLISVFFKEDGCYMGEELLERKGRNLGSRIGNKRASLYDVYTLLQRACADGRIQSIILRWSLLNLHVEEESSLDRNSGVPHWPPPAA